VLALNMPYAGVESNELYRPFPLSRFDLEQNSGPFVKKGKPWFDPFSGNFQKHKWLSLLARLESDTTTTGHAAKYRYPCSYSKL